MKYEDSVFDSIEVIGVFGDPCSSGLENWLFGSVARFFRGLAG
jgi:hypothetical protein